MKRLQIVGVLALLMFANNAIAARPGYTYAGVGYATQHIDDYDCNQDGLYIEGGLALDGQMILQGRHTDVTGNGCGSTSTQLSIGFRNEYGASSTVYALASIINRDYGADSDGGLGISLGIRTMYTSVVELNVSAAYESIDTVNQLYFTGGARYLFTSQFSLVGELSLTDDSSTGLSVGGRFSF